MTIILSQPYATYAAGASVDLDNATEAALVSQGRAAYSGVSPGSIFTPLTAKEQQALRDNNATDARFFVAYWSDYAGASVVLPNGTYANAQTDTTTTAGVVYPNFGYTNLTWSPSGAIANAIRFTRISKMRYDTTQSNSGAGHAGGAVDWYEQVGTGNPGLAIAHEAKFENNNASATITSGKGQEVQLSANLGTLSGYQGVVSQVLSNAGTISACILYDADISGNAGTISTLYGFYFHDLSAISGITSKTSFRNDDPNAPIRSLAPVVVSATQRASPTAGQTVTVSANKDRLILTPAGTLATLTILLPAAATLSDGAFFEVQTSQVITSLTWTCSGAAFILAPASLAIAKGVTIRWDSTNTAWWGVSY